MSVALAPVDKYDGRSPSILSGALKFKADGTVNLSSSDVKSGHVLVTSTGDVDMKSAAIKQGHVRVRPSLAPGASERQYRFTPEQIQVAWERAKVSNGLNSNVYRLDKCGNLISRHSYGKLVARGWHVDHSYPLAYGGTNHPNNLQALQANQNLSKGAKTGYDYKNVEKKGVPPPLHMIDLRSPLIKSKAVYLTGDGRVDARSKAVVDGRVRLRADGSVHMGSSAVKNGSIRFKRLHTAAA